MFVCSSQSWSHKLYKPGEGMNMMRADSVTAMSTTKSHSKSPAPPAVQISLQQPVCRGRFRDHADARLAAAALMLRILSIDPLPAPQLDKQNTSQRERD